MTQGSTDFLQLPTHGDEPKTLATPHTDVEVEVKHEFIDIHKHRRGIKLQPKRVTNVFWGF